MYASQITIKAESSVVVSIKSGLPPIKKNGLWTLEAIVNDIEGIDPSEYEHPTLKDVTNYRKYLHLYSECELTIDNEDVDMFISGEKCHKSFSDKKIEITFTFRENAPNQVIVFDSLCHYSPITSFIRFRGNKEYFLGMELDGSGYILNKEYLVEGEKYKLMSISSDNLTAEFIKVKEGISTKLSGGPGWVIDIDVGTIYQVEK